VRWEALHLCPTGATTLVVVTDPSAGCPAANAGAPLAEQVEGRVATEIDPRLAHDTGEVMG